MRTALTTDPGRAVASTASLLVALAFALPARANCFDGVRDGAESDVDCGGDCPECERGDACRQPRDCYSGRCAQGECAERLYLKGSEIPRGYQVEPSEADGAATARTIGWIALGTGYGAAFAAAISAPGEVSWLYVPVLGPWVGIAKGERLPGLMAVDGLLQTVGAGLVIGGIAAHGEQLVRVDSLIANLRLEPVVSPNACGLWLDGNF